jgi:hypothetical protein
MPFKCRFCGMKVFWNTRIPNPKTGKPTLCTGRGDEDCDIMHVCSIQRHLQNLEREEQAKLNFLASVKPETAAAILGISVETGISVIWHTKGDNKKQSPTVMTDNTIAEKDDTHEAIKKEVEGLT